MKIKEIEEQLIENRTKMGEYAKKYFEHKNIIKDLKEQLSQKRESIINVKEGDIIEISGYYMCGIFEFNGNFTTIKVKITNVSNKFIYADVTQGTVRKNNTNTYYTDVSNFKISKKNFYNMLYKISNYRDMVNRDTIIEDLLDE
tara:strand:- start:38481 stop:38912 length:432 start_codon:yes stop_codon:yes gene_type:complete